jgi:hypothetical protein
LAQLRCNPLRNGVFVRWHIKQHSGPAGNPKMGSSIRCTFGDRRLVLVACERVRCQKYGRVDRR